KLYPTLVAANTILPSSRRSVSTRQIATQYRDACHLTCQLTPGSCLSMSHSTTASATPSRRCQALGAGSSSSASRMWAFVLVEGVRSPGKQRKYEPAQYLCRQSADRGRPTTASACRAPAVSSAA